MGALLATLGIPAKKLEALTKELHAEKNGKSLSQRAPTKSWGAEKAEKLDAKQCHRHTEAS